MEGSQYHRNDLSEQDVLELIPRGLGLVQVEDGYWLCFQHRPTACPFPPPKPFPWLRLSLGPHKKLARLHRSTPRTLVKLPLPRDQKPQIDSAEPAQSTEHSSGRQGAQPGAEDRPRGNQGHHPTTSAQTTIAFWPSDQRCSSSWICAPGTSCEGQDLQQAGTSTNAGFPGSTGVDSCLGKLQRVGLAGDQRRAGLSDYEQQPLWKRSSMSHHSLKPSSMSRRRPASPGTLLPLFGPKKARSPLLPVRTPPTRSLRRRPRCMALWEHASVACGWSRLWQNTFRPTRSST